MELTINQALQQAIGAHKSGHLQEADRLYTAILKAQPKHPDANHNLGVLAVGVGKVHEALPLLKTALEVNPSIVQFWVSYIDALLKLEKFDEAKAVFDTAKSIGAKGSRFDQLKKKLNDRDCIANGNTYEALNPTQDQLQALIEMFHQGQLQKARKKADNMLQNFPESAALFNIYAAILKGLGRLDHSIDAFKKAISIKPDYAEAYNNLGNALKDYGRAEEALKAYNKAIEIKPDYADAYYNMGVTLQEQGDLDKAIEANEKALTIKPDYAEAYNNIGITLQKQDKLDKAIEAFDKALNISPDHANAHYNMGVTLRALGNPETAIEAYKKALAIKPDFIEAYNNMGNILKELGELEGGIKAYQKALAIKPDYAEVHRHLSGVVKYQPGNTQISEVEELLGRNCLEELDRCKLLYTYAKMKEDLGDLRSSFDSYLAGGKLRKKLLGYDFNQDERLFDHIKKTAPLFKELVVKPEDSIKHRPIFILGMPRSGTTLVEQIVSAHSAVTGAGELEFVWKFGEDLATGKIRPDLNEVTRFRERYLGKLAMLAKGKPFITDKMPQNFRYIPLICTALPEAKVIHVQRKPEAVCWSNFKHYFATEGLGYSYSLSDTVSYYELYKNLMRLWYQSYDDRIYNIDYDKLTCDQELETRRLIEYLELNWDEACLAPHENRRSVKTASQQQVRQKVYKGSSRAWRKYEPFLVGKFDALNK